MDGHHLGDRKGPEGQNPAYRPAHRHHRLATREIPAHGDRLSRRGDRRRARLRTNPVGCLEAMAELLDEPVLLASGVEQRPRVGDSAVVAEGQDEGGEPVHPCTVAPPCDARDTVG